ncbi:hypothetical protein Tco_0203212, partial [Tanacetum coccineum]
MYLIANRPDLVFAVCMCARYQAKPTKKHLEAIKRVFWYLKGTINMGLWYPKDNAMSLTAYADADHARMSGLEKKKGFRIYNKRTRRIMETIHVTFDELHQTMAPVHISSGLIHNQVHATNYVLPTDKDLELLFQPMFDVYFEVTIIDAPVPSATAVNAHAIPP